MIAYSGYAHSDDDTTNGTRSASWRTSSATTTNYHRVVFHERMLAVLLIIELMAYNRRVEFDRLLDYSAPILNNGVRPADGPLDNRPERLPSTYG